MQPVPLVVAEELFDFNLGIGDIGLGRLDFARSFQFGHDVLVGFQIIRRKIVRDTLVAIDARHTVVQGLLVALRGTIFLEREVHIFERMAVPAFLRVGSFHARPFMRGKFDPLFLKLLLGPDRLRDEMAVKLFRGLHLADQLRPPVFWHVAVRTGGANARAVVLVDAALIFGKDVVAHFVAADAKLFAVRHFKSPVEATPEDDTSEKADDQKKP